MVCRCFGGQSSGGVGFWVSQVLIQMVLGSSESFRDVCRDG